jgi:2'-5' RNA ligase
MRSFIAITLPTSDSLRNVLAECKQMGKAVDAKNLHLTLKFLGELSDAERIGKELEEIRFSKFSITLRGVGAFPSPQRGRVLFMKAYPEDVLGRLADEINRRTKEIPLDHPFTPHITLVRARDGRNFSDLTFKYENTVFIEQEINSFSLFESTLTPTGPIYKEIRKFQLI